jgi:hypothetical protein
MARKRLGEILLDAGVIDEQRLRVALLEQQRWGGHLGRILVDMKLVSEDVLVQALSQQLNFPAINLDKRTIPTSVLELVSGELAEQHSIIPFHIDGKFLDVAMTDPTNLGIVDELRIRTQLNVRPYLAGPSMIERALAMHYNRGQGKLRMHLEAQNRPYDPQVSGGNEPSAMDLDAGSSVDPLSAAARRAQGIALSSNDARNYDAEIANLRERITTLEALVQRDEDVIRKLMGLLVSKGIATREEILASIK